VAPTIEVKQKIKIDIFKDDEEEKDSFSEKKPVI
jgi:hypothetical protein